MSKMFHAEEMYSLNEGAANARMMASTVKQMLQKLSVQRAACQLQHHCTQLDQLGCKLCSVCDALLCCPRALQEKKAFHSIRLLLKAMCPSLYT
jgi:hypothetical protein